MAIRRVTPQDIADLIEEDFEFGTMGHSSLENPAMGPAPTDSNPPPTIDGRANRVITKIITCNAVTCVNNADKRCVLASIELGDQGECTAYEAGENDNEDDQDLPASARLNVGDDLPQNASPSFLTSQYDPSSGMPGQ